MTDKKLTDNEIKKALECSVKNKCPECPYFHSYPCDKCRKMQTDALDLINRYEDKCKAYKYYYDECLKDLKNANAENERLTIRLRKAEHQLDDLKMPFKRIGG